MISVSLKFNMIKANVETGKQKWFRPHVWEEKENTEEHFWDAGEILLTRSKGKG